jgi:sugar phosphate isomerase/epimerase
MISSYFINTVAVEPKRWSKERIPAATVSPLLQASVEAGFDGVELWQFHYTKASVAEKTAIAHVGCPVRIFNSYVIPGVTPAEELQEVADAVSELGSPVGWVKFNLGPVGGDAEAQIAAAMEWAAAMPAAVKLLCECHPGTVLETPEAAAAAFAQWPDDRFEAIVHPFSTAPERLREWFAHLGQRITHLHIQTRDADNRFVSPAQNPQAVMSGLDILREASFSGTASIEFVDGTNRKESTPAELFHQAVADLQWIKAAVASE